MQFANYNNLLETSDLNNFHSSLDKPNGYTFNQLVNILADEGIIYNIIEGFDSKSKDKEIQDFNKIIIEFKDVKQWKKVCEDYSLNEVFNIEAFNVTRKKDIFKITMIE